MLGVLIRREIWKSTQQREYYADNRREGREEKDANPRPRNAKEWWLPSQKEEAR